MDAGALHATLKTKHGAAIGDLVTDNPDPYLYVDKGAFHDVALTLRDDPALDFDYLMSISGVDTTEGLVCVYHLFSYKHRHTAVIKLKVPYNDTDIPSVADVWPAANWHEREQFDFFGFNFTGHPDLRRIMLPEDWVGHPLLKSYEYPDEYHGIDHYRPDPKDQFKALDELRAKAKAKKDEAASPTSAPAAAETSAPEA